MKKSMILMVAVLMACFMATQSHALLIGGPDIIAAPAFAIDDAPGAENDHQQAFDEVQNYLLTSALAVNYGLSIAAGTYVSSHMIFLNTPGTAYAVDHQYWHFDGTILGVMSNANGSLEAASSSFLGATGTTYPSSFPWRGMEGSDWYGVAGNSINVFMEVTEPGDWIRVITAGSDPAIPEPGTLLLLGSGLLGMVGFKRNKF